ncbi:hypothetical protein AB0333_01050 [Citricoccus sp. NPDC079358]|uniref:hypothetical protein n=1 Tax=Citricoccus sp. NPDC079358 TaxID=3154653 RepID=UPI00344ECDF8
METPHGTLNRDELQDYLNHHLLGSKSGVRLFQAAASTWNGTEYEEEFLDLSRQVSEEQDELRELIDRLDLRQSVVENALGLAAETAGRLNPVNITRSKSEGMTQVEMDILQSALQGKAGMYAVLAKLAERFPSAGLDGKRMQELYQQAQDQQARVRRISDETMDTRFVAH